MLSTITSTAALVSRKPQEDERKNITLPSSLTRALRGQEESPPVWNEIHRHPYEGCSEIFVGAGWGGIYSFYRRVLHGVLSHNISGHRYCLMEQSKRIGGRTYSVHVSHRHTGGGDTDFVLDVGAYRFSPDMHLVGDLILNQLRLPTECYEPHCASPIQDGFSVRKRKRFNLSAPFRRVVDPHTNMPNGFDTALHKMVETCQSLGARVFLNTKLIQLNVEKVENKTRLVFEDIGTGTRSAINSDDENANVVVLNLPRNHLFNVDGVRASLDPQVAKTLECVVFDAHETVLGKETVQRYQENEQYSTTFGKAYLYYEDAWWRSKLNQTSGTWPPDSGTMDAVQTPQGVLLNIRWHDGPVHCQQYNGLHISLPSASPSSSSLSLPFTCRGFLEVYYSVSNETFFSSLPAATNDDFDNDNQHMVDPLGMVWMDDTPHARSELILAHSALIQSLEPMWNQTPELSEAMEQVNPPIGMVVGIWQRPNLHNPLGVGWTTPSKVYYDPQMSGTPDRACGVLGLTDEAYGHIVLQPFDSYPFVSTEDNKLVPRRTSNIFLVNNDYVCSNIREWSGDWAEESLIQAERAMYILGTPKPSWLHTSYYRQHIVDPQQVAAEPFAPTTLTPGTPGMKHSSMVVLVILVVGSAVALAMALYQHRRRPVTVPLCMNTISFLQDNSDMALDRVVVMSNKDADATLPLKEMVPLESKKIDNLSCTAALDEYEGEEEDDDHIHDRNDVETDRKEDLTLWKLQHLAIPASYCVNGLLGGLFRTFLNVYPIDIGANEAQQTTIVTFAALPSVFMILFGFLSDTFPIFGYRRKPYVFLGWLLSSLSVLFLWTTSDLTLERQEQIDQGGGEYEAHQEERTRDMVIVPENAPSLVRLSCCFFMFYFGKWLATATADAWVAEKAKLESESVRGSLQSTCYVIRFFGSMVSGSISTYLYSTVGPQVVVVCMICTPLLVLPFTWWLAETKVDVKPVRAQCQEIWHTVCLRSVWEPIGFLFLHNVLQLTNAAWRQFMVTVLDFTPANLNILLVMGYSLVYLGTTSYKYCLLHTSWRLIYQWGLVLGLMIRIMQLFLIRGRTFGIPPFYFALVEYSLFEFLRGIKFLPSVFVMVALCPAGSEGISYCMFTTVLNSSWIIADAMSSLLLCIWDVSAETLENGYLDGLFKLSVLAMVIQFTPIFFMQWLPHGRKELEALNLNSFSGSPIGGAIFLFVLLASMIMTLLVSILNITRPGWIGES